MEDRPIMSKKWNEKAIFALNFIEKDKLKANKLLLDCLADYPDEAWFYIKLADSFSDNNFNEKIKYLDKAIEIEPENAWANFLKTKVFLSLGKYNKAIEAFNDLKKITVPDDISNKFIEIEEQLSFQNTKIKKKIICSLLIFYQNEYDFENLNKIISQIVQTKNKYELDLVVVLRDNSNKCNEEILSISSVFKEYIEIEVSCGPNIGFGRGHNKNLLGKDADYYLILNDDLVFDNFDWLYDALFLAESKNLSAVGALSNPCIVDQNGFGSFSEQKELGDYIDGSIMLINSKNYNELKGFSDNLEYFYFEDVDISLRLRQQGYNLGYVEIPHTHKRSSSSDKLPQVACRSIVELNRSRFLSKWSGYLSSRSISNKVLINITLDGIGDCVDCFFPLKKLIEDHIENKNEISIVCNKKIRFLYEFFNGINFLEQKDDNNYDSIYSFNDVNFSFPFHTLDLIAGCLGIKEYQTKEDEIRNYFYKMKSGFDIPNSKYAVLHIDSQRSSFEARMPNPDLMKQSIHSLIERGYKICLIGQKTNSNFELEESIVDARDISIQDTAVLINQSSLFFGIDSGFSHFAQLFNVPSYTIYGPVHPLTKIYRYHNSGCYFKNDESAGLYHRNLQPSYYFDISREKRCIDIDADSLEKSLCEFVDKGFVFDWTLYFDSLRQRQMEVASVLLRNPIMNDYNVLKAQKQGIKAHSDWYII